MQEGSVVIDQQLRAAFHAVIGKSTQIVVREDRKAWKAFYAQLPRVHKRISPEQTERCASAEGLIYERLEPWGFVLYRKGAQRPNIRPMAYSHEMGLHYLDAPASVSANISEGAAVELAQANGKNDIPQAKPDAKKTFKTSKQIAADAVRLIETARAEGFFLTCSQAVQKIIRNPEIDILAEPVEPGPRLSAEQDSGIQNQAQKLARQISTLVSAEAAAGRSITNAEALAIITQTESAGDPKRLARQAQQYVNKQAALGNRVTMAQAVTAISQQNH